MHTSGSQRGMSNFTEDAASVNLRLMFTKWWSDKLLQYQMRVRLDTDWWCYQVMHHQFEMHNSKG